MAGKGKKKRNSKDSTASNASGGDKKKGGGKSKKKTGSGKSSKFQGDIFNEGAMENAYFVCHNVQVGMYRISKTDNFHKNHKSLYL